MAATSPPIPSLTMFAEGVALHQRGLLDEAAERYRAVLEADPGHFDALSHLGLISLQQRNVDQAIAFFSDALDRRPALAEAWTRRGNALLAAARFEEAVVNYQSAIAIDRYQAEPHYGLGAALQGMERHDAAVLAYRRALEIDPDYAEAAYGLGTALQVLKHHSDAGRYYLRALDIDPDYPGANHNFAAVLQLEGRHEEAIARYRKAIASEPRFSEAYNNLGVALVEAGRLAEAQAALEAAIAINPKRPGYYHNLFDLKTVRRDDRHFLALQELAPEVPSMPIAARVAFHFTMGKGLADIGEYEHSFRHYLEGNALKRRHIDYDETEALRKLRIARRFFSAEVLEARRGCGHPSRLPVFIVGMPRSGSTLAEQILAAHPNVVAAGERLELRDTLNAFSGGTEPTMAYPQRLIAAADKELATLGSDYLLRLQRTGLGQPVTAGFSASNVQRITDKLPSNFALLGVIALILPNARIIHTLRDPIATCLSCFTTLFSADQPFTWDLGELGRYYRGYAQLMAHWRRVLPPGMMLDLCYEELVADFEPQARRIIAHCGLEWDDACLAPHKASRPVRTASAARVRKPVDQSAMVRWRPEDGTLQPLRDALGSELTAGRARDL